MYLVSKAYLEGFYYKPRIDMDLLRKRSEGLIATSGCLSAHGVPGHRPGASSSGPGAWWRSSRELFGDRYYLEIQRHGIGDQDRVNAELVKMSSDLACPSWPPTTPTTWRPTTTSTTTRCSASAPRPTSPTRSASASTARAST